MKLGDVLYKAIEKNIHDKNCELCINQIIVENTNQKGVYLCSKGLKFPKCRSQVGGFMKQN